MANNLFPYSEKLNELQHEASRRDFRELTIELTIVLPDATNIYLMFIDNVDNGHHGVWYNVQCTVYYQASTHCDCSHSFETKTVVRYSFRC